MGATQVVLQSFMPYKFTANLRYTKDDVDFRGHPVKAGEVVMDKNGNTLTVTIPALIESPKNVRIMTPEDFEKARQDLDPLLERGQRGRGIVQLDDIPAGFWDPAQRVADAEGKLSAAKAELEGSQFRILELEDEIKNLKEKLVSYGWKE